MRLLLSLVCLMMTQSVWSLTPMEEIERFQREMAIIQPMRNLPPLTTLDSMEHVFEYPIKAEGVDINSINIAREEAKYHALKKAIYERLTLLAELPLGEDRYAIVNTSSYKFKLFQEDSVVMDKKVIVGRKSRPTPDFSDTLTHLVLNPYWNVPRSLAVRDVIPKIQKEPATVDKFGYELVNRGTGMSLPIDPENITDLDLDVFRIRERPGPLNSLGQVKFMFPDNPNRSIFIHDTNAPYLFDREERRFSSGCIRLQKPFELASYLLGETESEIKGRMKGSERWVKLPEPLHVFVRSWPVYIDSAGVVRYSNID